MRAIKRVLGSMCLFMFAALAACAAPPAPAAAPTAGSVVLRVGYFPNMTHSQPLVGLAASNDTFRKVLGPNVQVDPKIFNAGPSAMEALLAGALDMTYVGPNPSINGYVKSNGTALRIIAGATSGGAVLVVRSDENISSVADLAGKRVATPELGNTQDVAARFYLLSNNLKTVDRGGTVVILPTANPDILTLFQKKELDAAWVPEPWGARLVKEANAKILVDEQSLWPGGQFVTTNLVVSSKFLTDHPDVVKKWLSAHVQMTEWIRDHPTEAKTIVNSEIARLTGKGLDPKVLDDAWGRMQVTYDPISTSLFTAADRAFQLGMLGKTKPELSGIYDLTLLNQVLGESKLQAVK
jgi:NitT/TauT family transport system substrate-binding protein